MPVFPPANLTDKGVNGIEENKQLIPPATEDRIDLDDLIYEADNRTVSDR